MAKTSEERDSWSKLPNPEINGYFCGFTDERIEAIVRSARGFTGAQIETLLKTVRQGLTGDQIDAIVKTVEPLITGSEWREWLRHHLSDLASYQLPYWLTEGYYTRPLQEQNWKELAAASRVLSAVHNTLDALSEISRGHLECCLAASLSDPLAPEEAHFTEANRWLQEIIERAERIGGVEQANRKTGRRGRPTVPIKFSIILELREMFEVVTGTQATRRVATPPKVQQDTGPFHDFVAAFWRAAFGSTIWMSTAFKAWAKAKIPSPKPRARAKRAKARPKRVDKSDGGNSADRRE